MRPVVPEHLNEPASTSAAPAPVPVLSYEKPLVYRYKSNLPPPGMAARAFWKCCYWAGKALGVVYRPRRPRQPYIRNP